jgi:phosphoglycerol transferase MdoB-like AlkP superfamily enzyme
MVYLSLILSLLVLLFVVRLTYTQRRFDFLSGLMVMGAVAVVMLDVDTLTTGRPHPSAGVLSLLVLALWLLVTFRGRRKGV